MTAQKVLDIGKATLNISWKLVTFSFVAVFAIILAFLKLWAFLDDDKDDSRYYGTGKEYWEMENPNAGSVERAEAQSKGFF